MPAAHARGLLGSLAYLYIGSKDFEKDYQYYHAVLGAERVWYFHRFGAKVAAFRVAEGPLVLVPITGLRQAVCLFSPLKISMPRCAI